MGRGADRDVTTYQAVESIRVLMHSASTVSLLVMC